MTSRIIYVPPVDKAQATNLIAAVMGYDFTPLQREEVMGILTRLLANYEQQNEEWADLTNNLSAALGEATTVIERKLRSGW